MHLVRVRLCTLLLLIAVFLPGAWETADAHADQTQDWPLELELYLLEVEAHHAELTTALRDVCSAVGRLLLVCLRIERGCEDHFDVRYIVSRWLNRLVGLFINARRTMCE